MSELVNGVMHLDRGHEDFIAEIRGLGGTELLECIQCAKCASVCPMALAGFPFYNKRVIQAVLSGAREVLLDDASIWACQSCNRCTEICPRRVNPYEVVLAMRRVAVREFAVPALTTDGLKSLYDYGHAVYLRESGASRRKVGLPETPPTVLADPAALAEVRAVLRRTALRDIGIIPMDGADKGGGV